MSEQDFLPFCDCWWCGTRKFRADIKYIDDKPICRKDCEHEYRKATQPGVPRPSVPGT